MRTSLIVPSALVVGLLLAGCGGSDGDGGSAESPGSSTAAAAASSAPASSAQVLELGKTDVALASGEVQSPAGFEPALSLDVPAGWTSVHRYVDAFDLGVSDPDSDGPLAVVVVSVAPEADAAGALAAVTDRQPDADVTEGSGTLLGAAAQQLDVIGGDGPAYTSRDGNVALDAADGQHLRFLATDTDAGALVVAVLVPGATDDALAQAMHVVGSARPVGAGSP